MTHFQLDGRTALVTGSTRGIGKAIADILEQYGARVIRHNSQIANLESAEEVSRFLSQCGHIDILVLNASMQFYDSVEAWNEEELRRELNVNLRASLQLIQAVVPGMRQQRWGRVLSIGSINQWKPSPRLLTYAASKAALSNLIQNCARQYAESGITFNTLAPGVITTDRNRVALSNQDTVDQLLARIPAQRFGTPQDCAGLALLLCSDAGSYITGTDIPVAGGMQL